MKGKFELYIFRDLYNFVDAFIRKNNFSYKTFHQLWTIMNFDKQLYKAHITETEVVQITTAALYFATRTTRSYTVQTMTVDLFGGDSCVKLRRICGFYLMYQLYNKQKFLNHVKIEVGLETWREMRDFIDSIKEDRECDQARYIFFKLIKENAFRYGALDFCVGLENLVNYHDIYDEMLLELKKDAFKKETKNDPKSLTGVLTNKNYEVFDKQISNFQLKWKENAKAPPPVLKDDIWTGLLTCLREINNTNKVIYVEDENIEVSIEKEVSNQRRIKDKAFKSFKSPNSKIKIPRIDNEIDDEVPSTSKAAAKKTIAVDPEEVIYFDKPSISRRLSVRGALFNEEIPKGVRMEIGENDDSKN